METLIRVSSRLWRIRNLRQGLEEILAATIELLDAEMGNIQLLDPQRKVLVIAAQRGFGQEFLDFFREVSEEDESACGRALRSGEQIIIEDVETDAAYAPLRSVARACLLYTSCFRSQLWARFRLRFRPLNHPSFSEFRAQTIRAFREFERPSKTGRLSRDRCFRRQPWLPLAFP